MEDPKQAKEPKLSPREKVLLAVQLYDYSLNLKPWERSKRRLFHRFSHLPEFKRIYADLIAEGEIHERGTGLKNDPIVVHFGPRPEPKIDVTKLPFPHMWIEAEPFQKFLMRMLETYEFKGWSAEVDFRREIRLALESYQPGRPY